MQESISDKVKFEVTMSLTGILDMMEGPVEQLFRADILTASRRMSTLMYNALEHVFVDQVGTAVLGETISKQID